MLDSTHLKHVDHAPNSVRALCVLYRLTDPQADAMEQVEDLSGVSVFLLPLRQAVAVQVQQDQHDIVEYVEMTRVNDVSMDQVEDWNEPLLGPIGERST
jgi:hypothetical protein